MAGYQERTLGCTARMWDLLNHRAVVERLPLKNLAGAAPWESWIRLLGTRGLASVGLSGYTVSYVLLLCLS